MTQSIKEIKVRLQAEQVTNEYLELLKNDPRKGVMKLLGQYQTKQEKLQEAIKAQEIKRTFDYSFLNKAGFIAGVDEAGRGPLAGPVTAAAVILPHDFKLPGLDDSKQITETKRIEFAAIIKAQALSYHVSVIDNEEIDRINIYNATKKAMTRALTQLHTKPDLALIDAVELKGLDFPTRSIIKGDAKSLAIAAASILAKVARDNIMAEIDKEYPQYEFKNHKGYGTKVHINAIKEHNYCKYHRKSFSPIKEMAENNKQLSFND